MLVIDLGSSMRGVMIGWVELTCVVVINGVVLCGFVWFVLLVVYS